jgi:hypothetical protein
MIRASLPTGVRGRFALFPSGGAAEEFNCVRFCSTPLRTPHQESDSMTPDAAEGLRKAVAIAFVTNESQSAVSNGRGSTWR